MLRLYNTVLTNPVIKWTRFKPLHSPGILADSNSVDIY